MDAIRGIKETAIDKINMATLAAFIPILNDKKADMDKIERKEFQYGQRNRHWLDVYYPPATSTLSTPRGKLPVLFFIYGGGYNTGARRLPEPYEMGYRALGTFFASRGFLTVIPDYRLVPEVRFPAASEDIRDALVWVAEHAAQVMRAAGEGSTTAELDAEWVFMLAHSAGAAHTALLHSYPPLRTSLAERAAAAGLRVRGLVLSGSPWHFNVRAGPSGPVKFYFGSDAQQRVHEPRGLWAALGEEEVREFPEVMLVQAEREPEWLAVQTREVMEREMREKLVGVGRTLEQTYIAAGHNHISMNWGLMTGDERGEKWAYDVVDWIKSKIQE